MTPRPRPRVAVVMVTYNSAEVVGAGLRALRAGAAGVDLIRVVVVDNNSRDDTVDIARRELPEVEVVQMGENSGYAAAINAAGLEAGDYDAVVILNPDTEVGHGCLRVLAEALDRPDVGIVVPALRGTDGSVSHSIRRSPSLLTAAAEALIGGRRAAALGIGEVVADPRAYEQSAAVDWATGAALAVGRPCQAALGSWDESFFLYSEETELMLRAARLGFATWFEPAAECYHRGGESGVDPPLWALQLVNKVALYRQLHGVTATVAFWAVALVGQGVRAMSGSRRAKAALRELVHTGPLPRWRNARERFLEMAGREAPS